MQKIKFELTKTGLQLVMKIIEQDPRFCKLSSEGGSLRYHSKTGMQVLSESIPELASDYVYLAGYGTCDEFCTAAIGFDSIEERDAYAERLLKTLKDWAENAIEFKGKPLPSVSEIYEF